MNRGKKAVLALEDGTIVQGWGFGACGKAIGEVVFNTSMTGYTEVLTNPSYNGQILVLTYPLIGNYKVHPEWMESHRIWAEGLIVREVCERPSHWKGEKTIDEFLREFGVPGMFGVDTRALTAKIRKHGVMKGILVTYTGEEPNIDELLGEVRKQPSISEIDLVAETTRDEIVRFGNKDDPKVALIDCGVKLNIIRSLLKRGLSVIAVPANTPADEIRDFHPEGIVVSNGPGDPAVVGYVRDTVGDLLPDYPTVGIGLGHQIIALACGARTCKLKFGHRGANQPVKDLETGRVHITSQNHGFVVDADSLDGTGLEVNKINCNDGTVEGISHPELQLLSVQYHPEDSPDPYGHYLFDRFARMVRGR